MNDRSKSLFTIYASALSQMLILSEGYIPIDTNVLTSESLNMPIHAKNSLFHWYLEKDKELTDLCLPPEFSQSYHDKSVIAMLSRVLGYDDDETVHYCILAFMNGIFSFRQILQYGIVMHIFLLITSMISCRILKGNKCSYISPI